MKRNLLALLTCMVMLAFSNKSNAQSSLIHYWNFNYFTTAMHTDTIHGIDADYSALDTAKAQILYAEMPGTSTSYMTYIDPVATSSGAPDYDTVNERFGDSSGNALRARNPSDSMQLLFYIPSTHYTHILLQYGSESSSATHGQSHQLFSYSVDSGLTWRTSGLSELSDSAWLVFHRTTVSIASDSLVKNTDKLVFRIIFSGNTTGTSGNNRFDNVTVEGDSIEPASIFITASPTGAVCPGTSVHFNATATHPYATPVYHWYVNGSSAGTDSTGFTSSTLITGSLVKCVITDSADGSVLAASNVITETVASLPNAGVITGASNVCPLASTTLSDTVTGGTWSVSNAHATITTGGVVTGLSTGIDTVTYSYSGICGSADTTFIIDISTTPSAGSISGASSVCIGIAAPLTETVSGGTWTTTNGNAAITSSGIVTGITAGTDTVIYAVATCGVSDTSFVITITPAPVAGTISGVSSICADSAAGLTETASGGVWTASNANATISASGIITGVNPGTDTIIYTVSSACETISATDVITVNTVVNPGTISGPDTVCIGHTIALTPSVTGGLWVASNANASVSLTGVVSGITAGTDSIVYGFENACGRSYAFHNVIVTSAGSCTTGIGMLNENAGVLTVYPNPANGAFTINCTSADDDAASVTITNVMGEKVKELNITTNQPHEITLGQPAGVYIINAVTNHGSYTARIILGH